jgi:protein TonB
MVAGLHVGFGALIVAGLTLKNDGALPFEPITATVIRESPVDRDLVPPVEPAIPRQRIDAWTPPHPEHPPEAALDTDAQELTTTVTDTVPTTGGRGAIVGDPDPVIRSVRPDPRHPLTQPPYPPAARRLGEQGVAVVSVYVLPNGQVGDARIAASSGFQRLDATALEHARRWRLLPATRDAAPYAEWYSVRVVFRIEDR